ncbi:MAG: polyprenyl synthetase family protein [Anaerolineales bacterium]|nr:polyprenyl synthetase family protein [Anaerolineales bacterium]
MVSRQIEQGLTAIDRYMQNFVGSEVGVLQDATVHIVTSGGKRVRPRLVLLAYLAAGGEALEDAVGLAAAVELVHTATLVHDDINDHSLTRRGKPTVHARWGRTFALLTGDYMFAKVYEMMAPYGNPFNLIMSQAAVRLVEGETLQAAAAKAGKMDRETYKRIIGLKTASLFEAGARMGAQLATTDDDVVEALSEFAYNLGLTFQIVDDILDIIGDPTAMGKPVGTDLTQNRGVMAVQNGDVHGDGQATAVAEADPLQKMMAHLRDSGAVEVAQMQANEMGARARRALHRVPPSPARDELESLIDAVLDRDR